MSDHPLSHIRSDERLGVFIDAANLDKTTIRLGFLIDFLRFRSLLEKIATKVLEIRYYTADFPNNEDNPRRRKFDWLVHNGYKLIIRTGTWGLDGNFKGNLDVDIAVEILEVVADLRFDHILLVSGDGDFTYLVNTIKKKGIKVTVLSARRTKPPTAADTLVRAADVFVDLEDLRPYIEKES